MVIMLQPRQFEIVLPGMTVLYHTLRARQEDIRNPQGEPVGAAERVPLESREHVDTSPRRGREREIHGRPEELEGAAGRPAFAADERHLGVVHLLAELPR